MKLQFKAKHVPFFTLGRFKHLMFGVLVTFGAGVMAAVQGQPFSYGAAWGVVIAFLFGLIWELSTALLASTVFKEWTHPFGDYLDFAYYVAGAVILALTTSLSGC